MALLCCSVAGKRLAIACGESVLVGHETAGECATTEQRETESKLERDKHK